MGSKKIIFCHSVFGHNLEYIHHLYMGYFGSMQKSVVFVVPEDFEEQKKLFQWPVSENIFFDLMSRVEVGDIADAWYKKHLRYSLLLRKYVKKHEADTALVIDIMGMMPYLPFVLWSNVKISGIVYSIYLYRWEQLKIHRRLSEIFWHTLFVKSRLFDRIFILNDKSASLYLNKLYSTNRFVFLPDPYVALFVPFKDLRSSYSIPISRKILFHFGSFGERKGTLLVLESILEMSPEERQKYVFVIAGIVQDSIKDRFYKLVDSIGDPKTVMIFDRFNSFEFIAEWCQSCDAILIPYLSSYQSSGIIGYAAKYTKPVISTSRGLIGKLVRKYHLGLALKSLDTGSLIQAYSQVENWRQTNSGYIDANSVENFNLVIDGKGKPGEN